MIERKSRFVVVTLFISLLLLLGCFSNLETDTPLALSTPLVTTVPLSTTGISSPVPTKIATSLPQPTDEPIRATQLTTPVPTVTTIPASMLQGNSWSSHPSLSGDGRFVVFVSNASNLVNGDFNNVSDIFIRDMQLGITERISVNNNGEEANGASTQASISADGNIVAFSSEAKNLVEGDTNNGFDVFVRDRKAGITERISIATDGEQSNGISNYSPAISADGRHVVFVSDASNLAEGSISTGDRIFIHDRNTRTTTQIDVGNENVSASFWPSISANGRFIVFTSFVTEVASAEASAKIYIYDRQTSELQQIAEGITPTISPSGRYVAFLRQSEEDDGIFLFVYDREAEEQKQIGWIVGGIHGLPDANEIKISADGRWIAFWGVDKNEATGEEKSFTDIFLYDQENSAVAMVSKNNAGVLANLGSGHPDISADGRWIVFHSRADNLVDQDTNGETDVFIYDRETGQMELVSLISSATPTNVGEQLTPTSVPNLQQGDAPSQDPDGKPPSISADGRFIIFTSTASNLVADDSNACLSRWAFSGGNCRDIFAHDREADLTWRVSVANDGTQANGESFAAALTPNGRYVTFRSRANNLASGFADECATLDDPENCQGIYLHVSL